MTLAPYLVRVVDAEFSWERNFPFATKAGAIRWANALEGVIVTVYGPANPNFKNVRERVDIGS